MTGEAAGAAIVSAPTCHAQGILLFRILDLRYLSDNFFADAPVEGAPPIGELYVNCSLLARHNQYRNPSHHAIVLNLARAIGKHGVFTEGRMC